MLPLKPTSQLTPLKKFATHTSSTCSQQAAAYGKCVVVNYMDIRKDICKEEFTQFGNCLRKAMRKNR